MPTSARMDNSIQMAAMYPLGGFLPSLRGTLCLQHVPSPSERLDHPAPATVECGGAALFNLAMRFVLQAEGRYGNDPHDSGGATKYGITQGVYSSYRKSEPEKKVKGISLTEALEIYRRQYWRLAHCADLPARLAVVQMDTAVNMGVGTARDMLDRAMPMCTSGTVQLATWEESLVVSKYLTLRRQRYHLICHKYPGKKIYLRGWLNRIDNLEQYLGKIRLNCAPTAVP